MLDDFSAHLRTLDPSLLVVPSRILRRAIKGDRALKGAGLHVPHADLYFLSRQRLLKYVTPRELGGGGELPDQVILLAEPSRADIEELPTSEILRRCWRASFHARVHLALTDRINAGKLTRAQVTERIDRVGQIEFDEIRGVLRQENLLLPPRRDRSVYVEFVALYLELRFFEPDSRERFFPTIGDFARIDAIVAADIDAEGILAATRLDGADGPEPPARAVPSVPAPPVVTAAPYAALAEEARQAEQRGNTARAALLWARAGRAADADQEVAQQAADEALGRLAQRLRVALGSRGPEAPRWCEAVGPLLQGPDGRRFSVEARVLYDLQKTCVDAERRFSKLDLVGWMRSFGRDPALREMPVGQRARAVKHLRSALGRVRRTRLLPEEKNRLQQTVEEALDVADANLREALRPRLLFALEKEGLAPTNLPERVARDKLVEQLCDRISLRGFTNLGDLRDAISRSHLKLPELTRLRRLLVVDELLGVDRRLARELPGAYRRGEIYLRNLQRVSALLFGTGVGRMLTRFGILPFLGAYVVLEGTQHLVGAVAKLFGGGHPHFTTWWSLLACGVFLGAMIHAPAFRRSVAVAFRGLWWVLKTIVFFGPRWLLRRPIVRWVLRSRPVRALRRYLLKPALVAGAFWFPLPLLGAGVTVSAVVGGLMLLVTSAVLNTRFGRDLEEMTADGFSRGWQQVRYHVIPGLVEMIGEFFKALVEVIERGLYRVDEWLRFRGGESAAAFGGKLVLGLVWSFFTYLVRIYVNLLIEPQVNPIKHFPVVTVSHKIILPFTLQISAVLAAPLVPILGQVAGTTIAAVTTVLLPGVFGFLVWEFKENWKLYDANRAPDLRAIMVGHHSETVLRLMKPGFHSGTLPRLYAKLRRAERAGRMASARKFHGKLEEVEHAVRSFVERDLIALLTMTRSWGDVPAQVDEVSLASNRIRVSIVCPTLGPEPFSFSFEEQSGWLLAGVCQAGWLPRASESQRQALVAALTGFYKMAGVDMVRSQIEACLGGLRTYDIDDRGLVVWPGPGYEVEAVYPLRGDDPSQPRGNDLPHLPPITLGKLFFSRAVLPWPRWAAAFAADQKGEGPPAEILSGVRLLPALGSAA